MLNDLGCAKRSLTSFSKCAILLKVMRQRYIDSHCRYTEVYEPEHVYVFTGPCQFSGKDYSVEIKGENLFRFRQTDSIYDLGLDADDREFVMNGISPEGWLRFEDSVITWTEKEG